MPAREEVVALGIQFGQGQEHSLEIILDKVQTENAKLLGIVHLKQLLVAGPPNPAPAAQATLVPVETVREFLKANGVNAISGSADARASVVRVICVRK